jgi:hypothetical protein
VIGKEADARFITVMKATGTGGWPPFAPKAIGDVSQVSGAASIDGGSILRCEADSTEMEVVFFAAIPSAHQNRERIVERELVDRRAERPQPVARVSSGPRGRDRRQVEDWESLHA